MAVELVNSLLFHYNLSMAHTKGQNKPHQTRQPGRPVRRKGFASGTVIEKFVRSGGKGGQNVNKTSTCVYLKHLPTGIEVKYQRERSQARNREMAYRLLAEKVAEAEQRVRLAAVQAREKERRRKRPRPAGLKERILENKKRTGEKKRLRAKKIED